MAQVHEFNENSEFYQEESNQITNFIHPNGHYYYFKDDNCFELELQEEQQNNQTIKFFKMDDYPTHVESIGPKRSLILDNDSYIKIRIKQKNINEYFNSDENNFIPEGTKIKVPTGFNNWIIIPANIYNPCILTFKHTMPKDLEEENHEYELVSVESLSGRIYSENKSMMDIPFSTAETQNAMTAKIDHPIGSLCVVMSSIVV